MRRREEPMEEQNRVNKEKRQNTQRQETEVVTGRKKIIYKKSEKIKFQDF